MGSCNQRVGGSNPSAPANLLTGGSKNGVFETDLGLADKLDGLCACAHALVVCGEDTNTRPRGKRAL